MHEISYPMKLQFRLILMHLNPKLSNMIYFVQNAIFHIGRRYIAKVSN